MNKTFKLPNDKKAWFSSWFNSHQYHKLYANRNDREAEQFIDAILSELEPEAAASMLDIGCGAGRHSRYLASKGFNVTGYDLSNNSITQAKRFESASLSFFQHDMRVKFAINRFDYAFNFFTSFGYFQNEEDNYRVVRNMAAALKKDGKLLIDYLNVKYSEEHLVPVEEKEIDGVWYHINRWSDDRWFYKRIAIDGYGGMQEVHVEQVAKFGIEAFIVFFEAAGLRLEKVYGSYELDDYNSTTSKRLILVAGK